MSGDGSIMQTLIQVASVVAGWIVVHKLSVARDIDKSRREMLVGIADRLSSDVTGLLDCALKYHTNPRNTEFELALKLNLQDISSSTGMLSEVSSNDVELRQCRAAILSLKKSITGSHFEDEHGSPIAEGSEQVQAIASDALKLKQSYQRLKQRQLLSSAKR